METGHSNDYIRHYDDSMFFDLHTGEWRATVILCKQTGFSKPHNEVMILVLGTMSAC